MKRLLLNLLVFSILFVVSCKDSVDPKTTPKEESVFYCILNADTTFQTAYLSKTYDVPGLNPVDNQTDPAVSKAVISINYRDKNYLFTDSSVSRTDISRYKNNFQFYYNNKLNLKSKNLYDVAYPVSVTVTLPDNKTISGMVETIPTGDIYFGDKIYTHYAQEYEHCLVFDWAFFSNKNSVSKYYYLPKLEINYTETENGVIVKKKAEVPAYTDFYTGKEILGSSKLISEPTIMYKKEYFTNTLSRLLSGSSDKKDFIIRNVILTIVVVDKNAASYYASNTTYDADFSVRIDAADVANIKGGYGLFGLYASKKTEVFVDKSLYENLGYTMNTKYKIREQK